jgi:hypothetical protein
MATPKRLPLPKHELRERGGGRFRTTSPCDACGKPVGTDFVTDAEVCDGSDGPGFYLCSRKVCEKKRNGLSVCERRAMYTTQRAHNNAARG